MKHAPLAVRLVLLLLTTCQTAWADQTIFAASLSSGNVITAGVVGTPSTATGTATFVLTQFDGDPDATTLSYSIQLTGVDLDGTRTADPLDNVTAIHLHNTRVCPDSSPNCQPGDTALTLHTLNIYGVPREDDDDMTYDAELGTVTGLWDVLDTDLTLPPTVSIADAETLDVLFGGDMFLNIHTFEVQSGAIGGLLTQVPEPGSSGLLLVAAWLVTWKSRRHAA